MTLGDLIKDYRNVNKISMDLFAQKSGLSKSYVSMLERNRDPRGNEISPSIETIIKVAKALGRPVDDVINSLDINQKVVLNSVVDDNIQKTIQAIADAVTGIDLSTITQSVENLKINMPEYEKIIDLFNNLSINDLLSDNEQELLNMFRELSKERKKDILNIIRMYFGEEQEKKYRRDKRNNHFL